MHVDPSVATLVAGARDGGKQAWDAIVERYAPLIWAICRRYRLDRPNADDVGPSVRPRLADQLAVIRDPAALPGWIATTTRRECGTTRRIPAYSTRAVPPCLVRPWPTMPPALPRLWCIASSPLCKIERGAASGRAAARASWATARPAGTRDASAPVVPAATRSMALKA